MQGALKTILRIAVLIAAVWLLAALAGAAPGASVTIGRKKRKGCWKRPRNYRQTVTGMSSYLVASPGTDVATVGVPLHFYP